MYDNCVTTNNILLRSLGLVLALSFNASLWAANLPNAQDLAQQLGVSQQDLARLNKGDIVYFDVSEGNEKELAAGAAMYLHGAPAKAAAFIKSKGLITIDSDLTSEAIIPSQATLESFNAFKLKAGSDEAVSFLAAKPAKSLLL